MLVCYVRELKEGFVEYVEEVVKIMVLLFKFYFYDGMKMIFCWFIIFVDGLVVWSLNWYLNVFYEIMSFFFLDIRIVVLESLFYLIECVKIRGD